MNNHDFLRPECKKLELELIATHSNGTKFYRCKSCGFGGSERAFTEDPCISQIQ